MSKQTGSFIVLILLAATGGVAALKIHNDSLADVPADTSLQAQAVSPAPTPQPQPKPEISGETDEPPIDTSSWKTYTSRNYPFTFKYPSTWKASPTPTTDEFDLIKITTSNPATPIHIFLSKKGYIGLDNVKTEPTTVGGQSGLTVQQALYGVEYKGVFYTFDLANAVKDKAEFKALVQSVTFAP